MKVGLSRLYLAEYHSNGFGGTSYTGGFRAARVMRHNLQTNDAGSDNKAHADNAVAEDAGGTFAGGTLENEVAELTNKASKFIYGLETVTKKVGETEIPTLAYNNAMRPKYLGYGVIQKLVENGVTYWKPVVLAKIKYNLNNEEITTQGNQITWQSDTISATVTVDDTEKQNWKYTPEELMSLESEADKYIRTLLNIADAELEHLTVISEAGSALGLTKITVTPELVDGRTYRYSTGATVEIPNVYDNLSSWATWDGVSEILAESGHEIIIAEVDSGNFAMAAGKTVATVNP